MYWNRDSWPARVAQWFQLCLVLFMFGFAFSLCCTIAITPYYPTRGDKHLVHLQQPHKQPTPHPRSYCSTCHSTHGKINLTCYQFKRAAKRNRSATLFTFILVVVYIPFTSWLSGLITISSKHHTQIKRRWENCHGNHPAEDWACFLENFLNPKVTINYR